VHGTLEGPENPFLVEREHVTAEFTVYVSADRRYAKLVLGDEERLLGVGEWSDWVPFAFNLAPTQNLRAECRFFLKRLEPHFEMYVSPPNIDPMSPALPISSPARYATDSLARPGGSTARGCPRIPRA
jgi:hypothetical protein